MFGEIRVYRINKGNTVYRVAMEEATPIRTALRAVEDSEAHFDQAHFEEFACHFLNHLQAILNKKPAIGDQLALVPIHDIRKIRSAVLKRLDELNTEQPANAG